MCITLSCVDDYNQVLDIWQWRLLCPKYKRLLSAREPRMLSAAVIFSGGQRLACCIYSEIYPQEDDWYKYILLLRKAVLVLFMFQLHSNMPYALSLLILVFYIFFFVIDFKEHWIQWPSIIFLSPL